MSPEERELLNKAVSLAEDNNKMLRYMKRSAHVSNIMRVIYWLIIIGSGVAGFYILQPYADQLVQMYQSVSGEIQGIQR